MADLTPEEAAYRRMMVEKMKAEQKWPLWKKGLVAIGVLWALGAAFRACGGDDSKPAHVRSEQAPAATDADLSSMISDYAANEVGGDNKYKDKRVRFSAVVAEVAVGPLGDRLIRMHPAGDQKHAARAFFDKDSPQISRLGELSKGQTITLSAECTGLTFGDLVFHHAAIE
jgi:hypothetical protein